MQKTNIKRAIVLAAGTGSRLRSVSEPTPKPLRRVGGRPLLLRVLTTLMRVGVREIAVVVGFEGDRIREALRAERLPVELEFVENRDFLKKNGVSLLAAAKYVDRECYLSMADHLYAPALASRLGRAALPEGSCALAVDFDVPRCFDLDDATKVRLDGDRICDIAKELSVYDALDTGVFRIGPSLIAELARLLDENGDCSLSEGVKALCEKNRFHAVDVGDARWIDVDTPEAAREAERLLSLYGEDLSLPEFPAIGPSPVSAVEAGPLGPSSATRGEALAALWGRALHVARARRQRGLAFSGDAE